MYFHIYNMFKKFYYYYLLKKKKSSCWHGVDVGVASLILRHVSCRAKSAEVGHHYYRAIVLRLLKHLMQPNNQYFSIVMPNTRHMSCKNGCDTVVSQRPRQVGCRGGSKVKKQLVA